MTISIHILLTMKRNAQIDSFATSQKKDTAFAMSPFDFSQKKTLPFGDVSEDVFDNFLYIFVHFVWNLFGGWKLFCTFAATIP